MGGSKPAHSVGTQDDGHHAEMMNKGDEHVPEERQAGVKSERRHDDRQADGRSERGPGDR